MKKTLTLVLVLALIFGCVNFASAEEIKDFRNYETQAREMETFCYQRQQGSADSRGREGFLLSRRRPDLGVPPEGRHHLG